MSDWLSLHSQEPRLQQIGELCHFVRHRAELRARDIGAPAASLPSAASSPLAAAILCRQHRFTTAAVPCFQRTRGQRATAARPGGVAVGTAETFATLRELIDTCGEVEDLAHRVDLTQRAQVASLREEVTRLRVALLQWKTIALQRIPPPQVLKGRHTTTTTTDPSTYDCDRCGDATAPPCSRSRSLDGVIDGRHGCPTEASARANGGRHGSPLLSRDISWRDDLITAQRAQIEYLTRELRAKNLVRA